MANLRQSVFMLVVTSLLWSSGLVLAAAPVVEIVAMPHPPVKAALGVCAAEGCGISHRDEPPGR
jgi:hypothetical protein